jgi:hypothetical protein
MEFSMSSTTEPNFADEISYRQWRAIRVKAGLTIDPQTAEVYWQHAQIMDPYGVGLDLHEEAQNIGRVFFARSRESNIWVAFEDLPDAKRAALWERIEHNDLTFPTGEFLADEEI